jgi:hypothetical protein
MGALGGVRRWVGACAVAGLAVFGLLSAIATASADPIPAAPQPVPATYPSTVAAASFTAKRVGPASLIVTAESGYCVGAPYRPSIERVAISDWKALRNGYSATLTVFVRTPDYSARSREVPVAVEVCAGVGAVLHAKVQMPRPIARTRLYDGSSSPPSLLVPDKGRLVPKTFLTR